MKTVDQIVRARVAIAASSTAEGGTAVLYLAAARTALDRATDEIARLRLLLEAREASLIPGEKTP